MCVSQKEHENAIIIIMVLLADYYDKLVVSALSDPSVHCTFLSISGVCPMRGDSALLYIRNGLTDSPDTVTGLFQLSDAVGGIRLSNNFGSAPFCLAFTVGSVRSDCESTLVFSGMNQALLILGSKAILSIGAHSVSFDLSFINAFRLKRAQICWDGSKASLFVNCSLVQSKEFIVTEPILS